MSRPVGSKNKKTLERMAANASTGTSPNSVLPAYATAGAMQKPPDLTNAQMFDELGSSGLTRFGGSIYEEFLNELKLKGKYAVYREMRDNSPVVSAILFAIEMALRRVKYYFETENDKEDELRDFLNSCLDDMSNTFQDTLTQIASMLQYGFSLFEIVYKVRRGMDKSPESQFNDGRIGWRKWLPLAQDTLAPGREWIFDETGGVQGINQIAPPDYMLRTLPIEKLLLFRSSVQRNNPEGQSLLRAIYTPWYFSKNLMEVEGIAAERMGTGIPVMYMGTDTIKTGTNSDVAFAKQVVRDTRADEQMGVVIPYPKMTSDGKGMLFELVSPPSRGMVDFDGVINRYEKRMCMAALAQFIMLGMDQTGSYALSKDQSDLFVLSISAWADSIAQIINRHALPRLLKLNPFTYDQMPQLLHSEVAVPDLPSLANYVNTLLNAQVLIPDSNLEVYLRDAAKLPKKQPDAPTIDDLRKQKEEQAKTLMDAQKKGVADKGKDTAPEEGTNPTEKDAEEVKEAAPKENASERFGGEGSGNFGHAGRPGERGGSGDGGLGNSEASKMPRGLLTKSEELNPMNPPKHSWRWMGKEEVDALLAGNKKYGGQPKSETESGNWFSGAPGNFAGYGKYIIEVAVPSKGVGLDAPTNSVGLDKVVGIWEHKSGWNSKIGNSEDTFTPIDFKDNNSESFQVQTRRAYGGAKWESATNEYQRELERIYGEWLSETAPKLAKETDDNKRREMVLASTGLLLAMLQQAGRKGIVEAMQLGAGGVLSPSGLETARRAIENNEIWLGNSLIPTLTDRLTKETADSAFMLGGAAAIQSLLQAYEGRIASYAGGYWTSIFEGVGDALSQTADADDRRIEIVLDDKAQHCKRCPELAGIYRNWADMLARSGIPGTPGRAECYSNCRCYIKVETFPGSGIFERM